jgi:hypothetical protein
LVLHVAVIQGYRERWVLVVGIDIVPWCFSLIQSHMAIDREDAKTVKTVNLYKKNHLSSGQSIIRLPAQGNIVNHTVKGAYKGL